MRPLPRSTRARILASSVVLLSASAVISVAAIDRLLTAQAGDRVNEALRQEVGEFRRLATGRDPRTGRPFGTDIERIFEVYLSRNVPGEGETIATYLEDRLFDAVSSADGRVPLSRIEHRLLALQRAERGDIEGPTGTVRYLAVPVTFDGRVYGTFAVLSDLAREHREIDDAVEVVAAVSGGVLLLTSLLAFLITGRLVAPLRELDRTARAITESDLSRRIDVRGNDEIAQLSRTFNAMLDRLEDAFTAQRAFINDASHELRTPITIVRGHLELLGDDAEERRETVALVTDELDRMTRFVEDLLLLAKAGRSDFLRREPVDLGQLTAELGAKARALAPRRWSVEQRAAGELLADRQRLTQAVMGLAQNAVQHTGEDDAIMLGTSREDGEVRLWVRDSGPGVAPQDRERIFERFARASNAPRRSDGAGLGLAIVRAIAEAHGGRVELDSTPGAGAMFTVVVPDARR